MAPAGLLKLAFARTSCYNRSEMRNALCILAIALFLPACGQRHDGLSAKELQSLLFQSVEDGDIEDVKNLLAAGVEVNAKNEDGATALFLAAQQDNLEIAELLISKGADVEVTTERGDTPLHAVQVALKSQNPDRTERRKKIAQLLLANGANINARCNAGETLLHHMVRWREDAELVKFYVSKGANINARNHNGYTPLDMAVDAGCRDIAEAFREEGGEHSDPQRAEVIKAAESGNLWRLKKLVADGTDIMVENSSGNTPLHAAAGGGHKDMVEFLIECGADVNLQRRSYKETALHSAASGNNKDIVELLIARGACVDARDGSGETPLGQAASEGYLEIAQVLTSAGANVNIRDRYGFSPLWRAANRGRLKIAQVLISAGADVNAPDNKGRTPLDMANPKVRQLLLKHGAVSGKELEQSKDE